MTYRAFRVGGAGRHASHVAATFVQAASPHLQPFVARPQDLPSL